MIHAIDRSAVQKICSGQVVVDLATAVKEMVENSLDSGATSIEVKLKEMGATLIEVSDNGSGIDPSNYSGIAMKHFTSKLQTFEDIYSVSSFGFRGEALNALCELSERFTVATKQDSQPVGTLLEFSKTGKLVSESVTARTTGTTVTVENLFEKLPVRRKEFVKSIKKHFQKMIRIVQSYALISVGIKIIVTNTNATGGKQTLLATQSGGKLSDNVSILFGAKFAGSLLPVDLTVSLQQSQSGVEGHGEELLGLDALVDNCERVLGEKESPSSVASLQQHAFNANTVLSQQPEENEAAATATVSEGSAEQTVAPTVRVSGLVSKVGLGVGRSDNDRQFTFCNGRPVDLPRFSKALNEVWRRYEMKQKPAFVLDITVPAGYFDVNLTPDKREVLIVQEADILQQLRDAVDCLYAPVRHTMQLNQGMAETRLTAAWPTLQTGYSLNTKADTSQINIAAVGDDCLGTEGNDLSTPSATGPSSGSQISQSAPTSSNSPLVWASQSDRDSLLQRHSSSSSLHSLAGESASKRQRLEGSTVQQPPDSPFLPFPVSQSQSSSQNNFTSEPLSQASEDDVVVEIIQERKKISWKIDAAEALECMKAHSKRRTMAKPSSATTASADDSESGLTDAFDIAANAPSVSAGDCHGSPENQLGDRSKARVLTKKDFPRMRVLGQFNLGFVIAELDGDLYILDQHACDEKYRFELLQRTTKLHQQPLIQPLVVETSAALELVIAEHQEVFAQNGFKLAVDLTAPAGQRVKLLTVPFSKTVHFGVDDVNELASMLSERSGAGTSLDTSDSTNQRTDKTYLSLKNDFINTSQSGTTVECSGDTTATASGTTGSVNTFIRDCPRLPKLLSMFASRACRSAIMIGTALRVSEMERVVTRLEQVEQPWNCPHGRPTLRHLVDLTPYWNARKRKYESESKYVV